MRKEGAVADGGLAEWSKAAALKADGPKGPGGSNPSPSSNGWLAEWSIAPPWKGGDRKVREFESLTIRVKKRSCLWCKKIWVKKKRRKSGHVSYACGDHLKNLR